MTARYFPLGYWPVIPGLEANLNSNEAQIRNAILTRLLAVDLPGIDAENIVSLSQPLERAFSATTAPMISLPCVMVCPTKQSMPPTQGACQLDDVFYPMLIAIVCADNQEPTLQKNLGRQEYWFQQIARAFRNQRLPGAPDGAFCSVQPFNLVIPAAWKNNLLWSALSITTQCREPRGVNIGG